MSLLERLPHPFDPDATYELFETWAGEQGLSLYPAQAEALIELVTGANVVLSTPTGSGKSLVALGAHLIALAQGQRTYYTAPIKALVSEKFFALVETFGAENVGMVTGDASVNPDAPIICCTAEILANLALRHGAEAPVGQVVMDEFHFYADPERGWAWQVPLLSLPHAQFLLMSATLGDMSAIADDLTRRTGCETHQVTGVERPVPLHFEYAETPVHETVEQLLEAGRSPIYIVHFSQAAAVERAQALASIRMIGREQRDELAEAIGDFRFTTKFGQSLSRLVRGGIGVHHAGMLPKYRRLVEQLAQRGLLRVICGTDTLGVGINVPIRTVLLTGLTKFDGTRMRRLTAREFHQIAGRAGRAGYDTEGHVLAQAPEHDVENAKAVAKAGDDPKKLRKIVRKKPPEGFVTWREQTLHGLIVAEPEVLTSRMTVTHSMVLNVIARSSSEAGGDAFSAMRELIYGSHETDARKRELALRALAIYRTLRTAGVVQQGEDGSIRLTVELQPNFALNQPLSPFALAVLELLEPESPTYALDAVSVIEATLDDPRPVLSQQQFAARGEAVAAMKAEGIEYEQRMELLEDVTWPQPLRELLDEAFAVYRRSQPWVGDFELSPKSVVRDLFEKAMTFADYINHYQLARSEGLVLRYLSDAYRALRQTVPEEAQTEPLAELIEWLGAIVRQVDSSLVDEWESLVAGTAPDAGAAAPVEAPPPALSPRALRVLVRNELFRRVQLAALENWAGLGELDAASGFDAAAWQAAMEPYFEEYGELGTGPDARGPAFFTVEEGAGSWTVRQVFDDPAGHRDWGVSATVDLAASQQSGTAEITLTEVGMLG